MTEFLTGGALQFSNTLNEPIPRAQPNVDTGDGSGRHGICEPDSGWPDVKLVAADFQSILASYERESGAEQNLCDARVNARSISCFGASCANARKSKM